jgi:hypothetical protein
MQDGSWGEIGAPTWDSPDEMMSVVVVVVVVLVW